MSSSILASYRRAGHSADVKMHLVVGEKTLSVGQLGPNFLLLDEPINHPPTTAILFYSIGGYAHEREVRLPEGISAASVRVGIAKG